MAKQVEGVPSKKDVLYLLKELTPQRYSDPTVKALDTEIERLFEEFRNTPKMKELERRRDKADQDSRKNYDRRLREVNIIRRWVFSEGVSPRVVKELKALVDEANTQE